MTDQGMGTCSWCSMSVPIPCERCPHCHLSLKVDVQTPREIKTDKTLTKSRKFIEREEPFDQTLSGILFLGIDPGARYTGVVVRDNDTVLHCSTFVRPKELDPLPWALSVIAQVKDIHVGFPDAFIAIEGITDPRGFHQGKRAPINPGSIMRTAAVAGACYATYPQAVIIPPGSNGSQHLSNYPDTLKGRRSKDIPGSSTGAGTRNHEQSAYDVAGKARKIYELTKSDK